jgi:hypothetical protein
MKVLALLLCLAGPVFAAENAKNYVASQKNDAMFNGNIGTTQVTQENSFTIGSNVLIDCVSSTVNGRKDGSCAKNPSAPECLGLNASVGNAVAAVECKQKDAKGKCLNVAGYGGDEWFTFANQYVGAMTSCKQTKSKVDAAAAPFESLSELIKGTGASAHGNQETGTSFITGSSETISVDAYGWQDGSVHLGYENGEIVRQAFHGASFSSLVLSSPFAEKLDSFNREKIETAFADPRAIMEKFQLAKTQEGDPARTAPAVVAKEPTAVAVQTPAAAPPPQVAVPAQQPAIAALAGPSRQLASVSRISPSALHPLADLQEPQDSLESRNSLAAAGDQVESISLFERISRSYRKRSAQMKALGSTNTSDAIKAMGAPEAFKNL